MINRLMTAIVVLGLVAGSAYAADDTTGWNAGAAASFGQYEFDNKQVDDSSTGFKLFTGYRFNKWLGVEGGYHKFGDFKEDLTPAAPGGDVKIEMDGFSVSGLLFAPLGSESFEAYGKAGFYTFDQQAIVSNAVTSSNSPDGLVLGAGARFFVSDRFAVRAEGEWFDIDDADLWAVNLGLEYMFGRPAKAVPVVAAPPPPPPAPPPPPPPPPAPVDSDRDGVVDGIDQCPGTPAGATVDATGCETQLVLRGVLFSTDSANLTEQDKTILDSVAGILAQRKGYNVAVIGHTDSTGADSYNLQLSQRRADAVRDYLIDKGIPASSLTAIGKGETDPIATNETADGRAENRRVTLDFSKR